MQGELLLPTPPPPAPQQSGKTDVSNLRMLKQGRSNLCPTELVAKDRKN